MTGTLKGYDQLLNLVLDEAVENLRGMIYFALSLPYICPPPSGFYPHCIFVLIGL